MPGKMPPPKAKGVGKPTGFAAAAVKSAGGPPKFTAIKSAAPKGNPFAAKSKGDRGIAPGRYRSA